MSAADSGPIVEAGAPGTGWRLRGLAFVVVLVGCFNSHAGQLPEQPASLFYAANVLICTVGEAIAPDLPTSSGGPVATYQITPAVPPGLDFSSSSGQLSGTPTTVSPTAMYTVTASNAGGETTAMLTITVNAVAPETLTYETNPVVGAVGQALAPDVPSNGGGPVVSYAISPELPAGLALDTTSGIVAGTPSAPAWETRYLVTATNSGGSTTAPLTVTVNDIPPTQLTYSANPAVFTVGTAIGNDVPTSTGGAVDLYLISPPLPVGLNLAVTTGVISGTPAVASSPTAYTVTALNSGGSTTVALTLSVIPSPQVIAGLVDVIAAGSFHTCAVVNGGIDCWGSNSNGQLGSAATGGSPVPTPVAGLTTGAQRVTAGGTHTCAVVNGAALCWGGNSNGQLGTGTTLDSDAPASVSGLTGGVQAIAAGGSHTCALVNGGVWCWGSNSNGQLGNGTTVDSAVPVAVTGLAQGVQAVAAGGAHSCAIVNRGALCWGENDEGQLGNGSFEDSPVPVPVPSLTSGVQLMAAGGYHTCAAVNGAVQCWGYNGYGQLGDDTTSTSAVPVVVMKVPTGAQRLAAGAYHTCAAVNGGAWCWGLGAAGQLGNASAASSAEPSVAQGLATGAQAVAAGSGHTCVLADGRLECFGSNSFGQLGVGDTTMRSAPTTLTALTSGVQGIGEGWAHTCAVVNGGLQCWGVGLDGELGNNTTANSDVPVQSYLTTGVEAFADGYLFSCAIVNGGVQCWGYGADFGELGIGSFTNSLVPLALPTLPEDVLGIAASDSHACALVGGEVQCWGGGGVGDLGDPSIDPSSSSDVPVQAIGLTSGGEAVIAALGCSCALVNGGVSCWGQNNTNLGPLPTDLPTIVPGLTGGTQAITGGTDSDHVCAIVNGAAWCWGANQYGQLGNGGQTSSPTPVQVDGLTGDVQGMAAGAWHSCAIVNGAAMCWGDNLWGELGNGTLSGSSVPVAVSGLASGVQAIAAGGLHTCALADGIVLCWGDNEYGELGDGTWNNSSVPVPVASWAE